MQALGNRTGSENGEKQTDDADPWAEGKRRDAAPVLNLTSCACKDGSQDAISSSLLKRTRSTMSSVDQ